MKFIRFKNYEDRVHWDGELVSKGEITVLRGGIYLLTEDQFKELKDSEVDIEELSPDEAHQIKEQRRRETA